MYARCTNSVGTVSIRLFADLLFTSDACQKYLSNSQLAKMTNRHIALNICYSTFVNLTIHLLFVNLSIWLFDYLSI